MANTAGVPTYANYRIKCMTAAYPATGMKVALYSTSATIDPTATVYTTTGEVTGSGYTAGGITVNSATAPLHASNTTYWTPGANWVFSGVSIGPTDCAMLYDTNDANANRGVFTFGAQTIVSGTLTLQMPSNTNTTALVRFNWT